MNARTRVRECLKAGIYHQNEIFALLYPNYNGHYSRLRQLIAEEKNNA